MIKKKPKGAPTKSGTHPENHKAQSPKKKFRPSAATAHPKAPQLPLSTHDSVHGYLSDGLAPVPIPKGSKGPKDSGWLDRVVTNDTVSDLFDVDGNVGIRTGPKSGDHVDVDVDDKEALELAELLLPTTAMTSGREGQGPSRSRLPPGVFPREDAGARAVQRDLALLARVALPGAVRHAVFVWCATMRWRCS
jgi:hypothetical protein